MPSRTERRLTLLDLMVLIAGFAVGLWVAPEGSVSAFRNAIEVTVEYRSVRLASHWAHLVLTHIVQPVVAAWTLTILALALRRRRSRRRLASEPGLMACLAAALAMLIVGPMYLGATRLNFVPGLPALVRFRSYLGHALAFQRAEGGVAVATAWVALILGGRWRPRPDWIDRCGRALGAFWIATIPVSWLALLLYAL